MCTLGIIAVLLTAPVHGQEPLAPDAPTDEVGEGGPPSVAEEAPAPPVLLDWGWLPHGPRQLDVVVSVAADGADVAVALDDGSVWRRAEGVRWDVVLDPERTGLGDASVDESVGMDIEARLGELAEDASEEDVADEEEVFDLDELEEGEDLEIEVEGEEPAEDVEVELSIDDVAGEVYAAVGDRQAAGPSEQVGARVWFDDDGVLWCGRSDGLYRVADDGEVTHLRVLSLAPRAFVHVGSDWLVGTSDGVRYVVGDQGLVLDVDDGTEGLVVHNLRLGPFGVVAATDRGVWVRTDDEAAMWMPVGGTAGRRVLDVLPRPDGSMLVATGEALFVLASLDAPSLELVPGPQAERLEGDAEGYTVAVGRQGVWASVDGAVFAPLERGLLGTGAQDAVFVEGGTLLATDTGLYETIDVRPDAAAAIEEGWIPFNDLLIAAIDRPEFRASLKPGARFLASVAPQFQIEARYQPTGELSWAEGSGTEREPTGDVWVTARMSWSRGPADYAEQGQTVVGNQVYLNDVSERAMVAAKVQRAGGNYERQVARKLSKLYMWRAAAVQRRAMRASGSLTERVMDELRILELEASIDVLTGGAVVGSTLSMSQEG